MCRTTWRLAGRWSRSACRLVGRKSRRAYVVANPKGRFAPDLSRGVGRELPHNRRKPSVCIQVRSWAKVSPRTAQNRRVLIWPETGIVGAPSFSPYQQLTANR